MSSPIFFARYPELAVYLAVGIGYWIGSFKIGGISLGGVTGSLLAGIAVGYFFHVPISGFGKSLVFMLFLFGIGYSVGPKFFKAMKGEGWKFGVLGAFVPVVGLGTAFAVARVLDLDPGFSGGLVSGALTESPAIGTASEAIQSLDVSDELKKKWISHVAVADALCYVFGALGVIWVCSSAWPQTAGHQSQGGGGQVGGGVRHRAHQGRGGFRLAPVRIAQLSGGRRARLRWAGRLPRPSAWCRTCDCSCSVSDGA